jgi:MFS superfamily sulfate permease-like transporter
MNFESLFQSGNIALVIIAVMLVEVMLLQRYIKRFPGMLAGLAAGACLVLALRAALLQQSWTIIAIFLALSFVFHILEILQWLRLAKNHQQ